MNTLFGRLEMLEIRAAGLEHRVRAVRDGFLAHRQHIRELSMTLPSRFLHTAPPVEPEPEPPGNPTTTFRVFGCGGEAEPLAGANVSVDGPGGLVVILITNEAGVATTDLLAEIPDGYYVVASHPDGYAVSDPIEDVPAGSTTDFALHGDDFFGYFCWGTACTGLRYADEALVEISIDGGATWNAMDFANEYEWLYESSESGHDRDITFHTDMSLRGRIDRLIAWDGRIANRHHYTLDAQDCGGGVLSLSTPSPHPAWPSAVKLRITPL